MKKVVCSISYCLRESKREGKAKGKIEKLKSEEEDDKEDDIEEVLRRRRDEVWATQWSESSQPAPQNVGENCAYNT